MAENLGGRVVGGYFQVFSEFLTTKEKSIGASSVELIFLTWNDDEVRIYYAR